MSGYRQPNDNYDKTHSPIHGCLKYMQHNMHDYSCQDNYSSQNEWSPNYTEDNEFSDTWNNSDRGCRNTEEVSSTKWKFLNMQGDPGCCNCSPSGKCYEYKERLRSNTNQLENEIGNNYIESENKYPKWGSDTGSMQKCTCSQCNGNQEDQEHNQSRKSASQVSEQHVEADTLDNLDEVETVYSNDLTFASTSTAISDCGKTPYKNPNTGYFEVVSPSTSKGIINKEGKLEIVHVKKTFERDSRTHLPPKHYGYYETKERESIHHSRKSDESKHDVSFLELDKVPSKINKVVDTSHLYKISMIDKSMSAHISQGDNLERAPVMISVKNQTKQSISEGSMIIAKTKQVENKADNQTQPKCQLDAEYKEYLNTAMKSLESRVSKKIRLAISKYTKKCEEREKSIIGENKKVLILKDDSTSMTKNDDFSMANRNRSSGISLCANVSYSSINERNKLPDMLHKDAGEPFSVRSPSENVQFSEHNSLQGYDNLSMGSYSCDKKSKRKSRVTIDTESLTRSDYLDPSCPIDDKHSFINNFSNANNVQVNTDIIVQYKDKNTQTDMPFKNTNLQPVLDNEEYIDDYFYDRKTKRVKDVGTSNSEIQTKIKLNSLDNRSILSEEECHVTNAKKRRSVQIDNNPAELIKLVAEKLRKTLKMPNPINDKARNSVPCRKENNLKINNKCQPDIRISREINLRRVGHKRCRELKCKHCPLNDCIECESEKTRIYQEKNRRGRKLSTIPENSVLSLPEITNQGTNRYENSVSNVTNPPSIESLYRKQNICTKNVNSGHNQNIYGFEDEIAEGPCEANERTNLVSNVANVDDELMYNPRCAVESYKRRNKVKAIGNRSCHNRNCSGSRYYSKYIPSDAQDKLYEYEFDVPLYSHKKNINDNNFFKLEKNSKFTNAISLFVFLIIFVSTCRFFGLYIFDD